MSILKCKMCGAPLNIEGNATVAVCEYCGTKQTIPKLDDDRRANLYDRAGHFRRNNEFDKAAGIYEQILAEDSTDAEVYWSLVLCRYGIEYVEDPETRKRIPTVNRTQMTSVYADENYKLAIRYADPMQRPVYEAEAKTIDEIQKGILKISSQEEPFDIFICYKETDDRGRRTRDSVLANELYYQLKQEGYKVFFSRITLEDKLGSAYEPYIFAALNSAKVMVVLGTKPEYFNAVWVKNEWSRYLALIKEGKKKTLIPAYRDMDPYDLPEEFAYLQALDMSKLGFMQDLIRGIRKIISTPGSVAPNSQPVIGGAAGTMTAPLVRRMLLFLETGEWESAREYAERILDQEPENAMAYVGKLMAEFHVPNQEKLAELDKPFTDNKNYIFAMRFADAKLKEELQGYLKAIDERENKRQLQAAYDEATRERDRANTEEDYENVAGLFNRLGEYLDAQEQAEQCRTQGKKIRDEREEQERKAALGEQQRIQREVQTVTTDSVREKTESKNSDEPMLNPEEQEEEEKKKPFIPIIISALLLILTVWLIGIFPNIIKYSRNKTGTDASEASVGDISEVSVGSYVFFGSYEQDNDTTNGKEDIEWLVLAKEDNKILVISKYALDCQQYNTSVTSVTWETCSLRKWLNGTFINNAFSSGEQSKIQTTTVTADKNLSYSTSPGNNTTDKVFLLSITEVNQYFSSYSARKCQGTAYCYAQGAYKGNNGNCWWWLRSPGNNSGSAAIVSYDGSVYYLGINVSSGSGAVRPALWINLGS